MQLALEALDPLADLEPLGRRARRRLLGGVERRRVDRLRPPAVEMVERRVVGDPQEPRAERRVAPEVLEPVEGAQERVLTDVLRLVGSDDPGGYPDDDRAVAVDELLKRAQLAARRAPDELASSGSSVVEEG